MPRHWPAARASVLLRGIADAFHIKLRVSEMWYDKALQCIAQYEQQHQSTM